MGWRNERNISNPQSIKPLRPRSEHMKITVHDNEGFAFVEVASTTPQMLSNALAGVIDIVDNLRLTELKNWLRDKQSKQMKIKNFLLTKN